MKKSILTFTHLNQIKKIAIQNLKKNLEHNKKFPKLQLSYKDPSFFNDTNIENQKKSLKTIFKRDLDFQTETIYSDNFFSNNLTNFPTITTEKSITLRGKLDNKKKDDLKYYERIFKRKGLWKKKVKSIDNLLNIRYADNEQQYLRLAEKENKNRIKNGLSKKQFSLSNFTDNQIKTIKFNIEFIKSIEDFVLPIFVNEKTRCLSNKLKDKIKENDFISPSHQRLLRSKQHQSERNFFLTKTISINDFKN